jgi:hypothetical protein
MSRTGVASLAIAVATVAAGQEVTIASAPPAGGAVLGRVCVDLDGDGRCGPGDPGVAGARILQEGGGVATADASGRFHLLEVPGRTVVRDRSAYGAHRVAAEGLGVRSTFELAPGGAAAVDLPVPAPPATPAPSLELAPEASGPVRGADGRPAWAIGGRVTPGAAVTVDGAAVPVSPDGGFAATIPLAPGENRFAIVVVAGGTATVSSGAVHLVARARGGDLVLPEAARPLARVALVPAEGGVLAVADLGPGERLRAGGTLSAPGRAAAYAPAGSSAVELVDGAGTARARLPLPAAPPGARSTTVGVVEVEVSFGKGPGTLVTGRGAAATRGEAGAVRWEAGVDADDRDDRLASLARPRDALAVEHAVDPVRTFSTAGDQGAADDRNAARGRVWGRVEGDGVRLDLGATRAGLTGSELGRYDRPVFGAKLTADRDAGPVRVQASAFGATLRADAAGNAPPVGAHDVLRATGGAAFWLSHGDVVPGSEALRVERRDPYTGRLTGQRALVRGVDYEIDFVTGRFVLAAPLASVAPPPILATADPFAAPAVTVIADYQHAAPAGDAEDLQGGRAGASVGPLSLQVRGAREVRPGEPGWELAAGTAVLDLGPHLALRAEAARTSGALHGRGGASGFARSDDGGLRFAAWNAAVTSADALHLEGTAGAGPVRLDGWWRVREGGYSDGEFQEAVLARERGARLALGSDRLGGAVRIADRRGVDPADPAGLAAVEARQLLARAGWQGERLGLVLEGVDARREDAAGIGEATSAGVRASWKVERGLTLEAGHHQKLTLSGPAVDPTFTSAGVAVEHGKTSLGVRGGWGPELGPRVLVAGSRRGKDDTVYGTFGADPDAPDAISGEAASALGVRQRAGATEVFSEEQFGRDVYGLRQSRVLGLGLAPVSGLTLSLSGERGQRLRLDGSIVDRSGAAAAAGWASGPLRVALRGELRDEGGDGHEAAGASAAVLVAPRTTVTARFSWTHGRSAGLEGLALEASLGAAWRGDRLSVLGNVARLVEQRPGRARRDGEVARLAVAGDPVARLRLGAGAAVAIQEVAGARDDRISGSVRAQVRVAGPADVAAEYARRGPLGTNRLGTLDAARAEAGVTADRRAGQARIAVGYNLFGFGGDGLSPAADTSRVYVRAQLAY